MGALVRREAVHGPLTFGALAMFVAYIVPPFADL